MLSEGRRQKAEGRRQEGRGKRVLLVSSLP